MPGTFSPPPRFSDPDMHHGTCATHVPWCVPGSLTTGFLWSRGRGKRFPIFPANAQPAILRIWQGAHGSMKWIAIDSSDCRYPKPCGKTVNMTYAKRHISTLRNSSLYLQKHRRHVVKWTISCKWWFQNLQPLLMPCKNVNIQVICRSFKISIAADISAVPSMDSQMEFTSYEGVGLCHQWYQRPCINNLDKSEASQDAVKR